MPKTKKKSLAMDDKEKTLRLLLRSVYLKGLEEKIAEIVTTILRTTPIAGDFDRTHAIYANEAVMVKLAKAIVAELNKGLLG